VNPFRRLIDWLHHPPSGTFADGAPRRYRQAVELTSVETRSHEGWVGAPKVTELQRRRSETPRNQDQAC